MELLDDFQDIMASYNPLNNRTKNILTKYERVKIIGIRAEQIQRGCQINVSFDPKNFDARLIAIDELNQKKLPFMVSRTLPDGSKEYWRLADMISYQ